MNHNAETMPTAPIYPSVTSHEDGRPQKCWHEQAKVTLAANTFAKRQKQEGTPSNFSEPGYFWKPFG